MAPKRKQKTENGEAKPSAAAAATRVTRSSTRRGNAAPAKAPADPEPPKKKKPKSIPDAVEQKLETPPVPEDALKVAGTSKTIIIEHCKQCNSFKTRALQVKSGLEEGVAGVNVLVNPEKPRKGCFEIRGEGEIFVSLLDLKRPFKKMKDLDMGEVVSEIIEKIK